jgi:membrane protease YdiL (CAAX protease family)
MFAPSPSKTFEGLQGDYRRETGLRRGISVAACLTTVLFWVWLLSSHLPALLISIPIVAKNIGNISLMLYIIIPAIIPIISLSGFSLYLYFSVIVVTILLSLLWVFKNELKEFVITLYGVIGHSKRFPLESKNSCILISQLFMAIISFSVVYFYLLQFFGVQITTPHFEDLPLWRYLLGMINASFYEEIATRVILIGIPLLIIHIAVGQNENRIYKYFLGGGFEIGKLTVFLIILSSLIFGTAHVIYGWDWYKFPQTFIIGIAFGYVFLKKGLYASILLHFAVDFSSALPMILLGYAGSVPIHLSPFYALALGVGVISALVLIALIVLGVFLCPIYFWHYTKNAVKGFLRVMSNFIGKGHGI